LELNPEKSLIKKNGIRRASPTHEKWGDLPVSNKVEIEQLVEVLKAVKSGDFTVRFDYEKGDMLGQAGELLNDIIGLNEHLSNELLRVGKIVGQEGPHD
jgi:hypothetical protein